jgi:hypothetical protein
MDAFLKALLNVVPLAGALFVARVSAEVPSSIAEPGATTIVTFHAEGAQIYECKPSNTASSQPGVLTWQFREPIATLLVDGKTTGRHYAGPNWDHLDGSGVKGKTAASAPGATANDIPWLKLHAVDHRGDGTLSGVTTVQRINTRGGALDGQCEGAGAYRSIPYSADYVFLRNNN